MDTLSARFADLEQQRQQLEDDVAAAQDRWQQQAAAAAAELAALRARQRDWRYDLLALRMAAEGGDTPAA